jgi:hypothetical protein
LVFIFVSNLLDRYMHTASSIVNNVITLFQSIGGFELFI